MAETFDPNLSPGYQGNMVTSKTSLNGVTPFLTRVYKTDDLITTDFYNGIGTPIGDDIPIVFGRVMLTGQVTSAGALRSDLDPAQVKQVVQFVTSEGPTKGIAGVGDEKMKNILINGVAVANESGVVQNKEFGWKEAAGIAASAGVMAAVPWLKKVVGIDPETGTTIPDEVKSVLKGAKAKTSLNNIEAMGVAPTGKVNDILAWDADKGKYTNQPFVDVHKRSGIQIDDFVVQKDGSTVRADTMTLNFIGTNWKVEDVGGTAKQVNITFSGTGTGGGTDPGTGTGGDTGGGTDPGTPGAPCTINLRVTKEPGQSQGKAQSYMLKHNGKIVSFFYSSKAKNPQGGGLVTASDAAAYIVSHPNHKGALKSSKFKVLASGDMISIVGDATCKPCDLGTWTLMYPTGNFGPAADPCAIKPPSA